MMGFKHWFRVLVLGFALYCSVMFPVLMAFVAVEMVMISEWLYSVMAFLIVIIFGWIASVVWRVFQYYLNMRKVSE